MQITEELKKTYRITDNDRILDVGGSADQQHLINIDTLVDIIPPEQQVYNKTALRAKNFVQCNIIKDQLPFENKQFDFCLCSHTIEDLNYLEPILKEMSRVAKRGLIVVPSRGKEMEFSKYDLSDWGAGGSRRPGTSHHHWIFEVEDGWLKILPKSDSLLYATKMHIKKWEGDSNLYYYWEDTIKYKMFSPVKNSFQALVKNYLDFIKNNRKNICKGRVLFYVTNPLTYAKEIVKVFLKRGNAFDPSLTVEEVWDEFIIK